MGPMQFIPGTWRIFGVDGDGDGVADPQDVEDAAAATAAYLCYGGRDLSQPADLGSAILAYNHSTSYQQLVLTYQRRYASLGLDDGMTVAGPADRHRARRCPRSTGHARTAGRAGRRLRQHATGGTRARSGARPRDAQRRPRGAASPPLGDPGVRNRPASDPRGRPTTAAPQPAGGAERSSRQSGHRIPSGAAPPRPDAARGPDAADGPGRPPTPDHLARPARGPTAPPDSGRDARHRHRPTRPRPHTDGRDDRART